MIDRTRFLTQNRPIRVLKNALRLIAERKSSSQSVGTANVRNYTSDSGSTYDWSGVLPASPQSPSFGTKILLVTATAQNQDNLWCRLVPVLYVNDVVYRKSNWLAASAAGSTGYQVQVIDRPLGTGNLRSWSVVITGPRTDTAAVKLFVIGNDTVSIAVGDG